jgi:hypothetical protein
MLRNMYAEIAFWKPKDQDDGLAALIDIDFSFAVNDEYDEYSRAIFYDVYGSAISTTARSTTGSRPSLSRWAVQWGETQLPRKASQ